MKKLLSLLLAVCMLVMAFSFAVSAEEPTVTETDISTDETQEIGATDYGTLEYIDLAIDQMAVSIAYPHGFETLDLAIDAWAKELVGTYQEVAALLPADENGMKGILNIDYYSFLYEKYASVLEIGEFDANVSGACRYIVKGFIYDMDEDRVVTIKDILSEQDYQELYEEVVRDGERDGVDLKNIAPDDLLANCALYEDKIIVVYTDANVTYHVNEVYEKGIPVVTPTPAPTPDPTPTPAPTPRVKPATQKAYVNGNKVNIRAEASSSSKSLARLPFGTVIQVVDTDPATGWTRIWYKNDFAYIFTDYVTYKQPVPKVIATGYVTGNSVYVRSEPNTTSAKLGVVKFRTAVKITAKEYVKGWDQILYNNQVAYISSKYVSDTQPTPVPKQKQIKPSWYASRPDSFKDMGTIKTNKVKAYSKTDTASDYYEILDKGTVVFIVEDAKTTKGWYSVWIETLEDPTKGYYAFIPTKYVKIEQFVGPVY